MMYNEMFHNKLKTYAELAVRVGLNVQKGQEVIIVAGVHALPLVQEITKAAYSAGASLVTPLYHDEEMVRERIIHGDTDSLTVTSDWLSEGIKKAIEGGAARLVVTGGNPLLLEGLDPDKVKAYNNATRQSNDIYLQLITQSKTNWSIVGYPTVEWAKQVFPDLSDEVAFCALAEYIFKTSRLTDTPQETWSKHNATLMQRKSEMNKYRFNTIQFIGEGTDLSVGLADGHLWQGGLSKVHGKNILFNPNIPTEEIFTTPHRSKVNGYVSSTKPLYHGGEEISGIRVEFKDGVVTKATAAVGEDALLGIIRGDETSNRLGEVALVPHYSPISQSGIVFMHTLYDENASCHIAFGKSYPKCMEFEGDLNIEDLTKRGANFSSTHVDWMIGSDKVDVYGIRAGEVTPIIIKGEWVLPAPVE